MRNPRRLQHHQMKVVAFAHTRKHRRFFYHHFIRTLPQIALLAFTVYGLCKTKRTGVSKAFSQVLKQRLNNETNSMHLRRFHYAWKTPAQVKFLNLTESRNRILYSPLRRAASDGIGHAFETMNAEVGAALRFGLTYTHRRAYYGSLTEEDRNAVEDFFGWNRQVMDRAIIRESFCNSTYSGHWLECQSCESLKWNESAVIGGIEHLVELPISLTYKRARCKPREKSCAAATNSFLQVHNKANTIFQMAVEKCDKAPVDAVVDAKSRAYFFHKYWNRWGVTKHNMTLPKDATLRYNKISSRFKNNALIIAVHIRRGDFFKVKSREMIHCTTYATIIHQVISIIQAEGGSFSTLPISIHIYSEGRFQHGTKQAGHDIKLMTKEFFDADGSIRNASWVEHVIRTAPNSASLFRNGLDLSLHIAEDTLQSLHEMIAADVFIGSQSAMSRYVVSALSRGGLQLVPHAATPFEEDCCHVGFRPGRGILDKAKARAMWSVYAKENERFLHL